MERNRRKPQEAARNHSLVLAKIIGLIRKIKNSTWRFGEPEWKEPWVMTVRTFLGRVLWFGLLLRLWNSIIIHMPMSWCWRLRELNELLEGTQQIHGRYRPQTQVLLGLGPVLEITSTASSPAGLSRGCIQGQEFGWWKERESSKPSVAERLSFPVTLCASNRGSVGGRQEVRRRDIRIREVQIQIQASRSSNLRQLIPFC